MCEIFMIWKYLFQKGNRKWLTLIMMATVNFSVAYKWSAFLSYQIPSVCLYLTRWWWAARKERLDYWWNNRYRTCQNEKKSCNIMVGLKIASKKKQVCVFFSKQHHLNEKQNIFFSAISCPKTLRYHLPLSLERHQFGVYLSFR